MKKPWFRCFPSNFLLGTAGMRPILFKTYTRLLMAGYEHGSPLAVDERRLGHILELRPQDVRSLLGELVGAGKIEIKGGFIHNQRTDHELSREPSNGHANGVSNGRVNEAPMEGSMDVPLGAHSGEKPNENHARAHDHTGAHARPRRAPATHLIEGGAPPSPKAGRAAPPTSTVSATAPEARKENGDNLRRRRTNDWDMEPAPGPIGQTPFLKKFAAAKHGDNTALDPLPGAPEKPKKETRQ